MAYSKDEGNTLIRSFEYSRGELVSITEDTNADGSVDITHSFEYDALSRLTNKAFVIGEETHNISYEYDGAGRRTKMLYYKNGTNNKAVVYEYHDTYGKLQKITMGDESVTFTYDTYGRLTKKILSSNLSESYEYDSYGRLNKITATNKTGGTETEVMKYEYEYTGGKIAKRKISGATTEYSYNSLGELVKAVSEITGGYKTNEYEYDKMGNRTKFICIDTVKTNDSFTNTYTYKNNRLTSYISNIITNNLYYDKQGRLTTNGNSTILYSADNTIREIRMGTNTNYFYQDALGNRVFENDKTLVYDGVSLFVEIDGDDTTYHLTAGLDNHLLTETPSETYFLLTDIQGSVVHAYENSGASADSVMEYTPYGIQATSYEDYRHSYTGREFDELSDTYYYRSRYYAPQSGRFNRVDDVRDGNNWVVYVNNDPINYIDPYGYWPLDFGFDIPLMSFVGAKPTDLNSVSRAMGEKQQEAAQEEFALDVAKLNADVWNAAIFATTVVSPIFFDMAFDSAVMGYLANRGALDLPNICKVQVFWSGGRNEAGKAAMNYAKKIGGETLEMTFTGRFLETFGNVLPDSVRSMAWRNASLNFAKGARGSIEVFHNAKRGVRLRSVWSTVEYPVLKNNNIHINYHIFLP